MSPLHPAASPDGASLAALGSAPQTLLLGTAAVCVLATLVWLFARSTGAGTALVLASAVQTGLTGPAPGLVWVGGVGITWPDVLTVAALAVGAGRLAGLRAHPAGPGRLTPGGLPALTALLLLTLCVLLVGIGQFGLKPAGLEVRSQFLAVFGFALYIATAPRSPDPMRAVVLYWPIAAAVLAAGALAWWAAHGIGSSSTHLLMDGRLVESRALDAPTALVVGQAALVLLCAPRYGPRARMCSVPLLLVVLVLQHRTVWVCTALMLLGWLAVRRASAGRRLAAAGLAAAAAGALTVAYGLGVLGDTGTSLSVSAGDDQTLVWRAAGWSSLIDTLHGPLDWLFGFPFGAGYAREISGMLVEVSPHNYFLQVLLRLGAVGLLVLLAVYAVSLRRAGSRSGSGLMLALLATGQLVFCLTYQLPMEQGLLIGLLVHRSRVPLDRSGRPFADGPRTPAPRAAADGNRLPAPAGKGPHR
ncbi:O-antigen ligase family protein [Kitasatospora arboriphila]|uniref:O-antigen ligase-related domain-containing protein n=1 Tax=Kitasatospora arboriphila TaxID=258052 RepID=A0ABN1TYY3_9ACTN